MGRGLGAGTNSTAGRNAALDAQDQIAAVVFGTPIDMLFITAGMGGGTGTGAAPVIAKMSRERGILTVASSTTRSSTSSSASSSSRKPSPRRTRFSPPQS